MFKFFGREYRTVHVGSNGYLTFGSGDFRYASVPEEKPLTTASRIEAYEVALFEDHYPENFFAQATTFTAQHHLASTDTHWAKPRISAWFQVASLSPRNDVTDALQDLDPSIGAAQVSVDVTDDAKVVITYQDVLCCNAAGPFHYLIKHMRTRALQMRPRQALFKSSCGSKGQRVLERFTCGGEI